MPPRRRLADAGPKQRQSKLAKEHNITPQEEADIREAFSLFSEPLDGEKEGVIPTADVRRAMIALGIPPTPSELTEFTSILDPAQEGFATFESFLAICALKLRAREDPDAEAHEREVDEAFGLFTGGQDGASAITIAHLKRVAALLREEDVTEELLRDMILEANGGAGVGRGVRREEFDGVMKRAGVWR
ncbi:hypothetical protein B0T16DRAFT_381854 [Cercophora newfieldiana]|uniref:Calmodulin n=1 Tax=Cercophora newfieldiana TaxID=92897 RepID=A0AA39XR51_9PEZI|nr:hypothetical protein B0T16DRAFT_381854 [Cercophora newfieldiana]